MPAATTTATNRWCSRAACSCSTRRASSTFEQDWLEHGWTAPALITLRLTPVDGGTLVELFHHGFERVADDPGELLRGFEEGWTMRQLEMLLARVAK